MDQIMKKKSYAELIGIMRGYQQLVNVLSGSLESEQNKMIKQHEKRTGGYTSKRFTVKITA